MTKHKQTLAEKQAAMIQRTRMEKAWGRRRRPMRQSPALTMMQQLDAYDAREDARIRAEHAKLARKKRALRQGRGGYVYLVGNTERGCYKIGVTCKSSPWPRINQIAASVPFTLDFHHMWITGNAYAAESRLHRRFARERIQGEWFKLPSVEIERICDIASQCVFLEDNSVVNSGAKTTVEPETTGTPESAQNSTELN